MLVRPPFTSRSDRRADPRPVRRPDARRAALGVAARSVVVAVLALAAVAPGAPAAGQAPARDEDRLAAYLDLARRPWTGSPCAGREVVHLRATAEIAAEAAAQAVSSDRIVMGMAAPASCEVWIRGGLSALDFCVTLVHELGHLAGHDHTAEAGDVMNGDGLMDHAPCRAAVPPLVTSAAAAAREIRSRLPAPARAWQVVCGPRRGSARACRAQGAGAVRRYQVLQRAGTLLVHRLAPPA
jgi:hypothetical protein